MMISFQRSVTQWDYKWLHVTIGRTYFDLSWAMGKYRAPWYNPYLKTNWRWLIRQKMGKRRVSSRAAMGTKAYPEWVADFLFSYWENTRYQKKWRFDYVVVSTEGADHGANYAAELARLAEEETQRIIRAAMTPERIAEMQAQRTAARAAKNFALADELRTQIEAAGVTVKDERLAK